MRRTLLVLSIILAALGAACAADHPKRRAPSGFTGVRGKKSIPDAAYSDTSQSMNDPSEAAGDGSSADKRAPSGFMGMRGKKPFPDPDGFSEEDMIKRAPSGFLGMRGKKDMDFENLVDEYNKRAPSGFMGMRGKKDFDDDDDTYNSYMDKRAPSGFMGMRGKKTFEAITDEMKRAQMSGFYGVRGKKQPSRSSFFGMRGKKYPYEFRGKFVGVRGKKSSNEVGDYGYLSGNLGNDHQLSRLSEALDLNQLMLLLTENNEASWGNDNEYSGQDHV